MGGGEHPKMQPDQGEELGKVCVRQADATVSPSHPGSPPGPWSASHGNWSQLGAVCLLPLFRQIVSFGAQMGACRVSGNVRCLVMRGSPGDTGGGGSGRGGTLCPPPCLTCGRQAAHAVTLTWGDLSGLPGGEAAGTRAQGNRL